VEESRERLSRELVAEKMPEPQALDMLLAVTEIATNARDHGGGAADVRVGRSEGRFVCEIVAQGSGFDDPGAGYLAPRTGVGAGLWVARQLTWRIEYFRAPQGFTAPNLALGTQEQPREPTAKQQSPPDCSVAWSGRSV
jgi:anti-sigma regulatory factor (Ser/Thr protein kinase)